LLDVGRVFAALGAFLTLVTFPVSAVQTPFRLTGQIIDQTTQQPVPGAVVSIGGLPGSVKTDAAGRFIFEPAPSPPFQLIVVMPGGQVARPFLVDRVSADLRVPVDALADESVTVVGAAPSIDAAPAAATTLLSSLQVARRSPENLLQALETVPGISQVSEGHAAVPAIRGMARGRVLLLIDGARVTSERRAGASATFLDPTAIEGLDVARGPGSVAYGSDALGGVISVRTKTIQPGSPLRVSGQATVGEGVPDRRGTVEVSKGFGRGGLLFQAHARGAGDWSSPEDDTSIFNSGWRDGGFLIKGSHTFGPGMLAARWQSDLGRDIDRPRDNSREVRFYYPYENSHRFTSSYELGRTGGFDQIAITGFLGTFEQRTDQDRFATVTDGRSLERADVSAKDFHVKATARRGLGRARLELGIDLNGRYGLDAIDIVQDYDLAGNLTRDVRTVSVDGARRTDTGAFVQADVPVVRGVRLAGGVRVDEVTTSTSRGFFGNRSTSHGAFSGFAAATVGPVSGLSFTGQLSRGFRDPPLSDRYFRGPSGRGFVTGNPDLEPETSLQFDLTGRYAISSAQIGVSYYTYRIDDLIERYTTDVDHFFFRNAGRARIRGFEIETRTDFGEGYSLELGAQIGRGDVSSDDTPLDDISPDTFLALLRKEFGKRAYAQVRMARLAGDDRPGPSEVAAPSATIVDLGGGHRLTGHLELRGQVRNLLDDSHYASPDPRWVWAPGRSASVTLAVQF